MTKDINNNLVESLEKFRDIAEQAIMGITVTQDGVIKYCNKRFNEINGYSQEDIKSWAPREYTKIIHPEDREFIMEHARKTLLGDLDAVIHNQYRIIRKDGTIRWNETYSKTIDYEGYPAILAMTIDITDKIKAEQQLKESEEKFSKAFNSNALAMSISTIEEGRIIEANDAFLEYLGIPKEEIFDASTTELNIWRGDPKVRERILSNINEQGSLLNTESQFRSRLGELRYGLFSFVKIELNQKPHILTIINDITQRRLAEIKLKESEEKFSKAFNSNALAMSISTLEEGRFIEVNDAFLDYHGYTTREEVLGKTAIELQLWDGGKRTRDRTLNCLKEEGFIVNVEGSIISKQGEKKNGLYYFVKIEFNKELYLLGIINDITPLKLAEKKLKDSKEKYYQAYNQVEFYKDLFIHDITNNLQSLYSSIQLIDIDLDKSIKTKETKELIDIIYRQINRGIKLTSNVYKLSQLEGHEISIDEVDLFEFLSRSIEIIKNAFQDREVQIKCDISSGKISILGNDLLQDVFENILINSVRYNDNDIVEIIIKASQVEQDGTTYCKLEFIDNGIGIEDERKRSVLTRADPTSKTTYGMGLGLSLVKKIIENYGGKIWIEDKVEGDYSKGTKVILLIKKGGS